VAIEVLHGPVVEALLERGFRVHAINPKQLDRFRDQFTVAGAKSLPPAQAGDDRRDARVLANSLRTDDPVIVELREWSRMVHDLQQERSRLANRVREQLWRFYPLEIAEDCAADWFLDCGARPRPRHRPRDCARPPSSGFSKPIASVAGRRPNSRGSSNRSRCRWRPEWPKRQPPISMRSPPASDCYSVLARAAELQGKQQRNCRGKPSHPVTSQNFFLLSPACGASAWA
jgi:Transposase